MKEKSVVTAFFILIFIAASSLLKAQVQPGEDATALRPPVEYKGEGLPEPFQLLEEALPMAGDGQEGIELPKLIIQGIVWGGASPQAIINNQIVKAGDTIEGARIESIAKEGLTVSFQGREFKLPSPASGNIKEAAEKPQGGVK